MRHSSADSHRTGRNLVRIWWRYSTKRKCQLITFDFLLRQAMQAVLTQRLFDVGPLSGSTLFAFPVDFCRGPLAEGSGLSDWAFAAVFPSMFGKSNQERSKGLSSQSRPCLCRVVIYCVRRWREPRSCLSRNRQDDGCINRYAFKVLTEPEMVGETSEHAC